ncbi:MAG: transporter [bacterium]
MRIVKTAALALFLLTAEIQGTPLIIRTGAVNRPLQVLVWGTLGYYQNNQLYNWTSGSYEKATTPTNVLSADILASVGLLPNLELGGVIPLLDKKRGEYHSTGLGDLLVIGRYGFLQFPLLPVKGALSLALSLPTGDKEASPTLGDGSTDLAAGLAFNTINFGVVVGHLRGAYWLNGKTNDSTKLGNMFEYLVGIDFPIYPRLYPQFALSGYWQDNRKVNGESQNNTELLRTNFSVLLPYNPLPKLVVRPKLSLPLKSMCRGGEIADYLLGVDIWTTLP